MRRWLRFRFWRRPRLKLRHRLRFRLRLWPIFKGIPEKKIPKSHKISKPPSSSLKAAFWKKKSRNLTNFNKNLDFLRFWAHFWLLNRYFEFPKLKIIFRWAPHTISRASPSTPQLSASSWLPWCMDSLSMSKLFCTRICLKRQIFRTKIKKRQYSKEILSLFYYFKWFFLLIVVLIALSFVLIAIKFQSRFNDNTVYVSIQASFWTEFECF